MVNSQNLKFLLLSPILIGFFSYRFLMKFPAHIFQTVDLAFIVSQIKEVIVKA